MSDDLAHKRKHVARDFDQEQRMGMFLRHQLRVELYDAAVNQFQDKSGFVTGLSFHTDRHGDFENRAFHLTHGGVDGNLHVGRLFAKHAEDFGRQRQ